MIFSYKKNYKKCFERNNNITFMFNYNFYFRNTSIWICLMAKITLKPISSEQTESTNDNFGNNSTNHQENLDKGIK